MPRRFPAPSVSELLRRLPIRIVRAPSIDVVVPVWGERYVDVFLNVSLAAQLAPGNIPALAARRRCRFFIYTREGDLAAIRAHPLVRQLRRHAQVRLIPVRPPPPTANIDERMAGNYALNSWCYQDCLARSARRAAPTIMLNADLIPADGLFRYVADLLDRGKRVLEVPAPRALKAPVVEELRRAYAQPSGAIAIPPLELGRLWITHMHPLLARHLWDDSLPPDDFHPTHLYWKVPGVGVLAHCFHLFPIMVWPRHASRDLLRTVDDTLVESVAPEMVDTDIPDSDAAFCIELSDPNHHVGRLARRDDTAAIADALLRHGTDRNFELMRHPIRIYGASTDDWAWRRAEAKAAPVISALLAASGKSAREYVDA